MVRLRVTVVASATLAIALMYSAAPATAARATASAGTSGQRISPSPSMTPRPLGYSHLAEPAVTGPSDYFDGNSCTGVTNTVCMAVGAYHPASTWNGLSETYNLSNSSSWAVWAVPSPATKPNIFGNEVSCASPTDCLFVGDHYNRTSTAQLAEAWNGATWQVVDSAGPSRTTFSAFYDVSCPTTSFCLLVGEADMGKRFHATAYTWSNQKTLKQLRVPAPAHSHGSFLAGLACASAAACMAVGNYKDAAGALLPYAERWHDGSWKVLATPGISGQRKALFNGASCFSAIRCVAVGYVGAHTVHAFAEVWSHGKWRVSTVRKSYSGFIGVSCPSAGTCFAAGFNGSHPLVEKWNGRSWVTQQVSGNSTNPYADLTHVSCVSTTNCEAVGYTYRSSAPTGDLTLAEAWDGHNWTEQTTPNP
jgi:hypothetical protein